MARAMTIASYGTVALLVAAGSGSRAGGETPKQYRMIGGKAVIAHAVDALVGPNRQAQVALPDRFVPVRDFLCATGRTGRIAPAHAATLAAQGYSPAQIDALALLGA